MPKVARHGQASVLSEVEVSAILRNLSSPVHRLIFLLAWYTGERYGAICQLDVCDVYERPEKSLPRREVIYRASTRKGSPDGTHQTRTVPVPPRLADYLREYRPPVGGFLFPSPVRPNRPITFDAADHALRSALERAGMDMRGISTHSCRRSYITRLSAAGVAVDVIRALTGHRSLAALQRYFDVSPERLAAAVAYL